MPAASMAKTLEPLLVCCVAFIDVIFLTKKDQAQIASMSNSSPNFPDSLKRRRNLTLSYRE